jgi:hypothetical protein
MRALKERTSHPGGQTYTGFSISVAQFIGSGERVFPALLASAFEQIDLPGLRFE